MNSLRGIASVVRPAKLSALGAFAAAAALIAVLALAPSPVPAQSPPATPASVDVTRADGTLTASWGAVDGATSYWITYSSDGGANWSLAARNHAGTSITVSPVTNSATYIVGVRARSEHGDSGWRNSPAAGPFEPPSPPATPASVAVARADGTLTASWGAVDGATSYWITYSSDGGASWSLAARNHAGTSITVSPVTNSATYIVGVRARSEHGDSGWRNSPAAGPFEPPSPPATPASVAVARADGTLTASWGAVDGATSYWITYSSDGGASWSLAARNHSGTGITVSPVTNSATYIVGVRARSEHGDSGWRNSPAAGPFVPNISSALSIADAKADEGDALSFTVTLDKRSPGRLHRHAELHRRHGDPRHRLHRQHERAQLQRHGGRDADVYGFDHGRHGR